MRWWNAALMKNSIAAQGSVTVPVWRQPRVARVRESNYYKSPQHLRTTLRRAFSETTAPRPSRSCRTSRSRAGHVCSPCHGCSPAVIQNRGKELSCRCQQVQEGQGSGSSNNLLLDLEGTKQAANQGCRLHSPSPQWKGGQEVGGALTLWSEPSFATALPVPTWKTHTCVRVGSTAEVTVGKVAHLTPPCHANGTTCVQAAEITHSAPSMCSGGGADPPL